MLKLSLHCLFHDKGNRVSFMQIDRHDGVVWMMIVLLGVLKEWREVLESKKKVQIRRQGRESQRWKEWGGCWKG